MKRFWQKYNFVKNIIEDTYIDDSHYDNYVKTTVLEFCEYCLKFAETPVLSAFCYYKMLSVRPKTRDEEFLKKFNEFLILIAE